MTVTPEEYFNLFGESNAWNIYVIKKPDDGLIGIVGRLLELPSSAVSCLGYALMRLKDERAGKSKPPTNCLFCNKNFLEDAPEFIALGVPAVKQGPGMAFFICRECEKDDMESAIGYKIGGTPVEEGHA